MPTRGTVATGESTRIRVLFVTPYPHTAADTRHRIEQFLPGLRDAGIDGELRPFMSERMFALYAAPGRLPRKLGETVVGVVGRLRDIVEARRFDCVFIHKEAFAFGPPLLEWALRASCRGPLLLDLDDAFWTHPPQFRQIGRRLRDPQKTAKLLRLASAVVAGNRRIADAVRPLNPAVTVIPTSIDTERFRPRVRSQPRTVTIGWVGAWWSAVYLQPLVPVFRAICDRYPHVTIRIIGAEVGPWEGARLECCPWRLETEVEDLQALSIGVMPLDDDEYARNKSGLKLLQYMGVGIPAVASPVGVNSEIVKNGQNGFLAGDSREWVEMLSALVEASDLRASIGAAGRRTAVEEYSLAKALPLLRQVISSAIAARKAKA